MNKSEEEKVQMLVGELYLNPILGCQNPIFISTRLITWSNLAVTYYHEVPKVYQDIYRI